MDLKIIPIIFVLSMVIFITPASAVSLAHMQSDINHLSELQAKHGFFAKIATFFFSLHVACEMPGFKKEMEESNQNVPEGSKLDDISDNTDEMLAYKNTKHNIIGKEISPITENQTSLSNETKTTPITVVTNQAEIDKTKNIIDINPPQACFNDITQMGGSFTKLKYINNELTNKTVQLIDPQGMLHYATVTSINNSTITLQTDKTVTTMNINDFKASYTGLTVQGVSLDNLYNAHVNQLNKEYVKLVGETSKHGVIAGICGLAFIAAIVLAVFGLYLLKSLYNARNIITKAEEIVNEQENILAVAADEPGPQIFVGDPPAPAPAVANPALRPFIRNAAGLIGFGAAALAINIAMDIVSGNLPDLFFSSVAYILIFAGVIGAFICLSFLTAELVMQSNETSEAKAVQVKTDNWLKWDKGNIKSDLNQTISNFNQTKNAII
jgi:hypothetical protein